jgi:hypothetical protein
MPKPPLFEKAEFLPLDEPQLPTRKVTEDPLMSSAAFVAATPNSGAEKKERSSQPSLTTPLKQEVIDLTNYPEYATASTPSRPSSKPSKKVTLNYKGASSKRTKSLRLSAIEHDFLRPKRQTRAMTKKRKLEKDVTDDDIEIKEIMAYIAEK